MNGTTERSGGEREREVGKERWERTGEEGREGRKLNGVHFLNCSAPE